MNKQNAKQYLAPVVAVTLLKDTGEIIRTSGLTAAEKEMEDRDTWKNDIFFS